MLSVCIPVYNFDVRDLVFALRREIGEHQLEAEIILIDDASDSEFQLLNKETQPHTDGFFYLPQNIGRSAIRNLFLNHARGTYMLFLDCDAKIISDRFLRNYCDLIKSTTVHVAYGGRIAPQTKPNYDHILRWNYARKREFAEVRVRQQQPYLFFQTNNFLIAKQHFNSVKFNSNFSRYGYEDLLFATDLQSAGIPILHIDNPIENGDIESNEIFLKKTEEAIESLVSMYTASSLSGKISEIKLIKFYNLMCSLKADKLFYFVFKKVKKPVRRNLVRNNPGLYLLDFYKLGLFIEKRKKLIPKRGIN